MELDKQTIQSKMLKSLDSLKQNLSSVRTGRAHPSLLDNLRVEYYGAMTPLNQLASIQAEDSRTLVLNVFDNSIVSAVEKAIIQSDLGLNPAVAGVVIRIPLPALTEERRVSLSKVVKNEGEQAKIAIRNIRRDLNSNVKVELKAKSINEDDARYFEQMIDDSTSEFVKKVDQIVLDKEKDIMSL